jgi:uncharacterized protein (DUF885 family)
VITYRHEVIVTRLMIRILRALPLLVVLPPLPAQKMAISYPGNELRDVDTGARGLMRPYIERFTADRGALTRRYPVVPSTVARVRLKAFDEEWLGKLAAMDFDAMKQDDRIDYLVFRNHLDHLVRRAGIDEKRMQAAAPLVAFAPALVELDEKTRNMETVDAEDAARVVSAASKEIQQLQKQLEADTSYSKGDAEALAMKRSTALYAADMVGGVRTALTHWYKFHDGYDPVFTWWVSAPYKTIDESLRKYQTFLTEKLGGIKAGDATAIPGKPIGREALMVELAHEMIPYTPEELIAIANKEFAWCEDQMKQASREMGFGEDWKKAVEKVKTMHVPPGKQPELVRDLTREAEAFMDKNDLVTIPRLARETWRMEMMSPERQLVNPFFTGGETITVSYPTETMTEDQKEMSMRGNNIPFSRATVFHEMIPGHELQLFMTARYRQYRAPFATPFAVEGWSLYWEMLMWDLKFARNAEDRVGMLFWRMHRCARIIFSLSFHLGKMTPEQAIDFLVDRVGHERDNAAGEVRRSFNGSYAPLYQAAYLLGGMQIYALHKELVGSGKMTNRQFHDAILRENRIPIEMIRASLTNQKLTRDFVSNWKFYGPVAAN